MGTADVEVTADHYSNCTTKDHYYTLQPQQLYCFSKYFNYRKNANFIRFDPRMYLNFPRSSWRPGSSSDTQSMLYRLQSNLGKNKQNGLGPLLNILDQANPNHVTKLTKCMKRAF